jgi:arginine decarboxylase
MDQSRAPILEAIDDFHRAAPALFTVHGHKCGAGTSPETLDTLGTETFRHDMAATKGLDDRADGKKVIENAQKLCAELVGADHTFYIVNGSSLSVQAALMSVAGPGEKIAVARNVHKSVIAGLILGGADPVFMKPGFDDDLALTHPVPVETVRSTLERNPDVRAVFAVSPSYYGVAGDVRGIAEVSHAHGIPLVVDGAWGLHFPFHPELPPSAIHCGADLEIGSVHKNGSGLAQSSILSMNERFVTVADVQARVGLLETASPSVPIFASIDGWRRAMALDGERLLGGTLQLARRARRELAAIDGLRVIGEEILGRPGAHALDETKIVIDIAELGITGFTAWDWLDREQHVLIELEDHRRLVPLLTIADDDQSIDRLVEGMRALAGWAATQPRQTVALPVSSALATECAMSPRAAFFAAAEEIPITDAVGRISAEMASPYPPGVPAICPGELITEAIVDYLRTVADLGALIPDARDGSMKTIRVVR